MYSKESVRQLARRAAIYLLTVPLVSVGLLQPVCAQTAREQDQAAIAKQTASEAGASMAMSQWSPPASEKGASSIAEREKLKAELALLLATPSREMDGRMFAYPPLAAAPQSTGRRVKKGPLITGLIGLGLVGAGAYFVATPNPPRTVGELFDEHRIDRRYSVGIPLVTLGGVMAIVGFLKMR